MSAGEKEQHFIESVHKNDETPVEMIKILVHKTKVSKEHVTF